MKKTLAPLMTLALAAGIASIAMTSVAAVKKNDLNKKEVEKILKEAGDTHFVEKMKISQLCSMKMEDASGEDTYFHIYNVSLREGGYRIVIFDNTPKYLGYYNTEFEGADYEEGAILLDSGDSDEDGNTTYYTLPISAKGPADKIRIDGVPTELVKAPGADEKKASGIGKTAGGGVAPPTTDDGTVLEYRDWNITMRGKVITANAIFVSAENGKVTIKDSKLGNNATVPVSALSAEDVEYLKKIMAK